MSLHEVYPCPLLLRRQADVPIVERSAAAAAAAEVAICHPQLLQHSVLVLVCRLSESGSASHRSYIACQPPGTLLSCEPIRSSCKVLVVVGPRPRTK